MACSAYGKLELHAALHRKLRERELTRAQLAIIFDQLELDEVQHLWKWLPLSESIMASVMSLSRALPEHVFVRTADLVHLVTAMSHGFREVYSNDIHLLAAAPQFGLHGKNVIDPV